MDRLADSDEGAYVRPALRTTGIVLTSIGLAGGLTGLVMVLASNSMECSGEFCGLEVGMGGVAVALVSAPFLLSGIPMWIVGSRRIERPDRSGTARLLPSTLSLGPTSATARWEF